MVICAGPTGAGKTTTLYATLLEINSTGKNVTTVEDPVEYVFPGINQVQTNVKAGLTFATGLKALLRQDPDMILVGEIRDADTARIAIQSALTGHFVLSSLHGTDAVAALHRLLDMGIEAFLVASADRRRGLPAPASARCATTARSRTRRARRTGGVPPSTPAAARKTELLARHRLHATAPTPATATASASTNSSASPRRLRRLIVGWATTEELRRLAVAQGMRTMLREAMQLVEDDVTTVPEVIRTLFAH